ncbi:MAG: hypothetical protein V2J25_15450 [Desulfatiglans sp.]|jgi:hypothetical protein|nr:hypothetical protein [Thermodesulfobacteriota bacterium]MEE4354256.1 hypothetical protein [Desulfatiglans sp.]
MKNIEDRILAPPLNDIKDMAVMLDIAGEYLCEDRFLKKIGSGIMKRLGALEDLVEEVKKEYVGKPVGEIDLSKHIKTVTQFAERLQKLDKNVKSHCNQGRLGKELVEKIFPLANGFNAYKDRLEGKSVSYSTGDSVSGLVEKFESAGSSVVAGFKLIMKICLVVVLVCLIACPFLYFTMEKEGAILKRIEEAKESVEQKKLYLSKLEADYKKTQKEIETIQLENLGRREIVDLIDINLKAYKFSEEMQGALIDIKIKEKALEDERRRLDDLKNKPFLKRLFRL